MSKNQRAIFSDLPDYDKMPPVHLHDDYLGCLKDYGDETVYCTGKTYVKPDPNSAVWNIIQVSIFKIQNGGELSKSVLIRTIWPI